MVNPFTVVQPLPFDCMLYVGRVVDISNSELNLYGLLSFVFDQSCALSMFSLYTADGNYISELLSGSPVPDWKRKHPAVASINAGVPPA